MEKSKMTKKVALYVRTTPEEAKFQIKQMKQFCVERGWDVFAEYVDSTESYRMWTQLFKDIKLEQFDVLLFYQYSDFARIHKNNFVALNKLRKHHISWHSLSQPLCSTENLNAQMMLDYLDLFYSVYKNHHSVETRKGQQQSKDSGIHIGRSSIPDEARNMIIELRAQGLSYGKIKSMVSYVDSHNKTRHPSKGTIHNILKNHADCSKSDMTKKPSILHENRPNRSKIDDENAEVNS